MCAHRVVPVTAALFGLIAMGVATSCARFRIEELKPTRIAALPIARENSGNREFLPQVKMAGHVPYNLPVQPVTNGSRLYIPDPERRLVRVFDSSGELVQLVAPAGVPGPEDVPVVRVAAGIPGLMAVDEDGRLFVQYRSAAPAPAELPAKRKVEEPINRIAGIFDPRDRNLPPSVVVSISRDGKTVETLGKEGPGGAPFAMIYRMDVDAKNRLIITHKQGERFFLTVYEKNVPVTNFENLAISDPERKYLVRIEDVSAGPAAEFALACAVYRDSKTHAPVFRKVFRFDSPAAQAVEVYSTDDSRDFCGRARPDRGFYMMNAEKDGSRILFKIFNAGGEYINNRLVRFPGMHASWRLTYMRLDGRIFSSRVYRGQLELYEWK